MVTDINCRYTSPAGKEFTILTGRYTGIAPGSRVLDMGCGLGAGTLALTNRFRCQVVAIDIEESNIEITQAELEKNNLSHLVSLKNMDVLDYELEEEPFDLVMAEGGILSLIGREKGLRFARDMLSDTGWFSFSDLVLLTDEKNVPKEVLSIFDNSFYKYETEESYRRKINQAGFESHIISLIPPSGWDNYYAHMSRHLEDKEGIFANQSAKELFHREIDIFYRLEGFRYIGYLYGLLRKKSL